MKSPKLEVGEAIPLTMAVNNGVNELTPLDASPEVPQSQSSDYHAFPLYCISKGITS